MPHSLKSAVHVMTALAAVVLLVLLVFESGMFPGLPALPSANLIALFVCLFLPKLITHREERAAAPAAKYACAACAVLAVLVLIATVIGL